MKRFQITLKLFLLCVLLSGPVLTWAQPNTERWIWIDAQSNLLRVMQGEQILQSFQNISVGRNGTAPLRQRGDGKTPLGTYHVRWINRDSRYHIFLGIDYPNDEQAEAAWRSAIIDFDTYYDIRKALVKGRVPPQNTPLGGYIGIHGTGDTSERFHRYINWTQGCVALTNQQIEQLSGMVGIGTKVVISNGVTINDVTINDVVTSSAASNGAANTHVNNNKPSRSYRAVSYSP